MPKGGDFYFKVSGSCYGTVGDPCLCGRGIDADGAGALR